MTARPDGPAPDQAGPEDLDPDDLDLGPAADPVPSANPSPVATDRQRAAQGGRWGIISGVSEQLGSMAATIVLARLLSPEDFGVVAAATLLLNLLFMVGNVGFGASLIKRRSIEEPVSSTTFWAASGLGLALTAALVVASPVLARLLGEPDITPYVIGLAPILALSMVSNVSEARLLRELRFPWVYTADIANIAVYAAVTLALAAGGAGAWSMVVGRLAGEVVAGAIRLVAARWRPRLLFDWGVLREDLGYNRSYLAMQVGNFFSKNLDYWVVSRTLGARQLGIYYVAFVLPTILRQRMTWLATEILMPIMARAADDRDRLVGLYRETLQVLCFVSLPLLVGIALTADQIIGIAFGSAWLDAVGPLRWLAVAAAIEVTAHPAATLFLAIDEPGVPSRMMRLRVVLMAAGLAVAVATTGQLTAIAASVAAASALSSIVPHRAAGRAIGAGPGRALRWLAPILVAVAAMAAVVAGVGRATAASPIGVQAAAMASAGALAYLASVAAVDRPLLLHMRSVSAQVLRRG